jgi:hypothetical protein
MKITKSYFKNIISIVGIILTLVTAVVLLQEDAMVTLGLCGNGKTLCIILANIGAISTLAAIIVFISLLIVLVSDLIPLCFKFALLTTRNYFKNPNFKNVKISFVKNDPNEIAIQVLNKEWRYPEVLVEAIIFSPLNTSNNSQDKNLGVTENLKWKDNNSSGLIKIKKRLSKQLLFLKIDEQKNEFYIDVWEKAPHRFSPGKYGLMGTFFITINNKRIIRRISFDVNYIGKKEIEVVNIKYFQDEPPTFHTFRNNDNAI